MSPCTMASEQSRLSELVTRNFHFIRGNLRRLGVLPGDVDDVMQRVFLTASRRLGDMREGSERSFLVACARGEARHARRSYRRRGEVSDDANREQSSNSSRPDELAGRAQALAHAALALEAMDAELRRIFVLFEIEELTSQQIAELLEIPLGTAKSRLRRARGEFLARTAILRESRC